MAVKKARFDIRKVVNPRAYTSGRVRGAADGFHKKSSGDECKTKKSMATFDSGRAVIAVTGVRSASLSHKIRSTNRLKCESDDDFPRRPCIFGEFI